MNRSAVTNRIRTAWIMETSSFWTSERLDIKSAPTRIYARQKCRERYHLRIIAGQDRDDNTIPRIGRGILPVETLVHSHLLDCAAKTRNGTRNDLGHDDDTAGTDSGILCELRIAS